MPDVDRHLGRARPRDEIGSPQHIEEVSMGNPGATPNELLFHHRDVRRRAAECDNAELQERLRDPRQGRFVRAVVGVGVGVRGIGVGTSERYARVRD